MYKFTKLLLIFLLSYQVLGQARVENSQAFIIRANPTFYKVVSPVRALDGKVAVIIQNKTLSKIKGKFIDTKGRNLEFVSIESGEEKNVEFKFNPKNRFFFVPLDPAFQKIHLNIGKKAYEIPAQK